jgi:hypothetical protein
MGVGVGSRVAFDEPSGLAQPNPPSPLQPSPSPSHSPSHTRRPETHLLPCPEMAGWPPTSNAYEGDTVVNFCEKLAASAIFFWP